MKLFCIIQVFSIISGLQGCFLCGLFYDALRISDYVSWNGRIMCNEFERIWKEAVMA
jgi:hypothetical protein